MTHPLRIAFASALCLPAGLAAAQFQPPVPSELAMTSIPQVPGAPAVILYKEQTAEDKLHMWSYYARIKVLTEGGKDYANIELPYFVEEAGVTIDSIVGRTIQPDGTIVAFNGKPYDKLIVKSSDTTIRAKVFTLPQVQVGSILEYRYKFRFSDGWYLSPEWYLQSDLYTMKAHYNWLPSTYFTSGDMSTPEHVAWAPTLPKGVQVVETNTSTSSLGASNGAPQVHLSLDVHDLPPIPKEHLMPPEDSVAYRVQFYYTAAKTPLEYWIKAGKGWSKDRDKFIDPKSSVRTSVTSIVQPSDTQEQKVKKIYDFVMTLENTDFTRAHSAQEEKAGGLKTVSSSEDILLRKRGSSDQLAQLFVAMVRAAGIKAYLTAVSDRSQRTYNPFFLSLRQLDDYIAVVSIDGKDVYLDPGTRFCTFRHLSWKHALTGGIRQTDTGIEVINTPPEPYSATQAKRIADLTLNDRGEAAGTVTLTYTGDAALNWRQEALRGDDTSLNGDLRRHLEQELPGGMEVRVTDVSNLADPDKPLVIQYEVKGLIGAATGKRLLVPASLFEANSRPQFTAAKRELAVDMHYPEIVQDAVRVKYPASLTVESAPAPDSAKMANAAAYSFSSKTGPSSITLFRNITVGKTFFGPDEYPDLKAFYGKLDTKQGESLVLTRADTSKAAPGGN